MNLIKYICKKSEYFARNRFFKSLPSLCDWLLYEDFLTDKDRLFIFLKDSRIGVGIKIEWPHHLITDDRGLSDLETTVSRFLQRLDHNYQMQFQLEKTGGSFAGYVFIISSPMQANANFVPKTLYKVSLATFNEKIATLHSLLDSFSSAVVSEGAKIHNLNEKEFVNLLAHRLGAGSPDHKDLSTISTISGEIKNHTFFLGEKYYKAIVPTYLPAKLSSQVLRVLYFEQINFLISVGLRTLSKEETEARINKRKFWLQNALGAAAVRQRDEVEGFEKEFAGGERLVATTLVVICEDHEKISHLTNLLSQSTLTPWTVESAGAARIILDALPMHHNASFLTSMGRSAYLPSSSCSKLLPLCSGSLQKNHSKVLQYPSSEGELTGFDLRDTPGCHTAVIAGTRSGKSFLIANILHCYLSSPNPPAVSIIDKRASYETLTRYHGGAVVAFTQEKLKSSDFPFHPLAGSFDDGHIEFLCSYISLLAELAKPDEPLYATDKVVISEALVNAISSLKISNQLTNTLSLNLTMSDIAAALGRSSHPSAKQLAFRLRPFYGNGTYAAYFDRELKNSLLDTDIVSFDLDGLEADPLLQSAISQAILGQTITRMRQVSKQGRWGILLVEEIGVLGDSIKGLAQFVADAWKTMAKMGIVCIGVTNDVEDFLYKPAAKAIWNNSPNKIYLRMTNDQIRSLITASEHGPAVIDGQLAKLLPCLKTIPGKKADFILTSEDRIYPLAFQPDQKSYWLGTSKHEDVLKIKQLSQTMPIQEVIKKLSAENI